MQVFHRILLPRSLLNTMKNGITLPIGFRELGFFPTMRGFNAQAYFFKPDRSENPFFTILKETVKLSKSYETNPSYLRITGVKKRLQQMAGLTLIETLFLLF